jgi:hypothetical protein
MHAPRVVDFRRWLQAGIRDPDEDDWVQGRRLRRNGSAAQPEARRDDPCPLS